MDMDTRVNARRPIVIAAVVACLVMGGGAAPASAQTTIARTVLTTGGGVTNSPTMSIHCTIGEPAVGRVVSVGGGRWRSGPASGTPRGLRRPRLRP